MAVASLVELQAAAAELGFDYDRCDEEEYAAVLRRAASRDERYSLSIPSTGAYSVTVPAAAGPDAALLASWGAPGGDTVCVLLDDAQVAADVLAAAEAGRSFASMHLGAEPPPRLGFYLPEDDDERAYIETHGSRDWPVFRTAGDRFGFADHGTRSVAVRADVSPGQAAETAAHEVFHIARQHAGERDALAYGEWARGVLCSDGRVAAVYRTAGYAYEDERLNRIAREGDVALAGDGVYRCRVSSGGNTWVRYHGACPVAVERG